jgi:hypothetical protein
MPTRREQILSRITTILAATAGVSGRVYRSRVEPIIRGQSPAIVVEPVSDQAEQTTLATLNWSLVVRVTVFTRGAVPDQLADPVVASVYDLIMQDTTLNGYAIDVLPIGTQFEMIEADQAAGVVACDFSVRYRTPLNTLTVV